MSTLTVGDTVASVLFGKVQRSVLALLFCNSDRSYYLREIVRLTGCGQGAVQRELERLVHAGLAVCYRQGNSVYYQANQQSPVFPDLRNLMAKTAGVADILRTALAPLTDRIQAAFIYGSVAQGREKAESDVDVMVIGEVSFGETVAALLPTQTLLGREVNPSVYSPDEIRMRLAGRDHFLTTVFQETKIFLIGDEHELGKLAP